MVNIHTHTLSFWRARRCRLSVGLVVGHTMKLTLADVSPVVDDYRRAPREVTLLLVRSRRVTAPQFNVNSFCSSEALALFRFLPSDIGRLADLLHVEDAVAMTKYAVTPVECLCIVVRRLASPARWVDLEELFGRSSSALCTTFFFYNWDAPGQMGFFVFRVALIFYARPGCHVCIEDCRYWCCSGSMRWFYDGTALFVSRTGAGLQRSCYSGHKRRHAIKFQSVLTPDGLVFRLSGPVDGRRHDMTLYHESGLDATLASDLLIEGQCYYVYGDTAYFIRPRLLAAFPGILTPQQEEFNTSMKVPRTAVQWGFKDVKQICSSLDLLRKLKIRQAPVAQLYKIGISIWNLRYCAYGGATASFFDVSPPTWEEYLGLEADAEAESATTSG